VLLQQLGVADDMAKRRAQVMRYGIGERFQFPVGRLQIDSMFCQLFLGLPKTFLNPSPNRAEAGNDESPNRKNEKIRQVSARNFEGVVGLREEVVEAQRRQHDRRHGGSVARIPSGDGDGESEDRHRRGAELIVLQRQGQADRDSDGSNSQAIARDRRLESVQLLIPSRQKAPGTAIGRWLGEVSHSSFHGHAVRRYYGKCNLSNRSRRTRHQWSTRPLNFGLLGWRNRLNVSHQFRSFAAPRVSA
jgi:hypothetical protein